MANTNIFQRYPDNNSIESPDLAHVSMSPGAIGNNGLTTYQHPNGDGGGLPFSGNGESGIDLSGAPGLNSTDPSVIAGSGLPKASTFMGIDPTTLLLGGLSLLKKGPQKVQSFSGDGIADPRQALLTALQSDYRRGQQLSDRKPVQLRSSMPPPPAPIHLPGLGFQIGGGLANMPYQPPVFSQDQSGADVFHKKDQGY